MSARCSECSTSLFNPYLGVFVAERKNKRVKEGRGTSVCASHLEDKKMHSLTEITEKIFYRIDSREGAEADDGRVHFSLPDQRVTIEGYLTRKEIREYLPCTYERLFR